VALGHPSDALPPNALDPEFGIGLVKKRSHDEPRPRRQFRRQRKSQVLGGRHSRSRQKRSPIGAAELRISEDERELGFVCLTTDLGPTVRSSKLASLLLRPGVVVCAI